MSVPPDTSTTEPEAPTTDVERAGTDGGAGSSIPGLPPDWPQRATNTLVSKVDEVRVKTSGPAISVARMVVYGITALPLLVMAIVLLVIGLVRVLDIALDRVWLAYLILGGVFTLGGLILWAKRPKGAARVGA